MRTYICHEVEQGIFVQYPSPSRGILERTRVTQASSDEAAGDEHRESWHHCAVWGRVLCLVLWRRGHWQRIYIHRLLLCITISKSLLHNLKLVGFNHIWFFTLFTYHDIYVSSIYMSCQFTYKWQIVFFTRTLKIKITSCIAHVVYFLHYIIYFYNIHKFVYEHVQKIKIVYKYNFIKIYWNTHISCKQKFSEF